MQDKYLLPQLRQTPWVADPGGLPAEGARGHAFIVGSTDTIWAWDIDTNAFVDTGSPGTGGPQGLQGDQGIQGIQGIQGEQGDQGVQGEQGIQGEQGEQGIQGIQGDQGIQGEQGEQGIQGIPGPIGAQGIQGEQGELPLSIPDGDNLFNIADEDTQTGRFVNPTTGALNSNASHNATHFISVRENQDYFFTRINRIAWYDSDQNFISGEFPNESSLFRTSPANAAFMRVSVIADHFWPVLMITTTTDNKLHRFKPWTGVETLPIPLIPNLAETTDRAADNLERLSALEIIADTALDISPNLFNINHSDSQLNSFVNHANGTIGGSTIYNATHFIKVSPGDELYLSSVQRFAWYDAVRNYITGEIASSSLSNGAQFVVPDGVTYLRVSVAINKWQELIIAKSDAAIPFQAFGASVGGGAQGPAGPQGVPGPQGIQGEQGPAGEQGPPGTPADSMLDISPNLFNIDDPDSLLSSFVNPANGTIAGSTTYNATHFIKVSPGDDLYLSSVQRFAWYDEDKNFVSGSSAPTALTQGAQFVVPDGVHYIRFSVFTSRWQELIVAISDTAIPFQPFGPSIGFEEAETRLANIFKVIANTNNTNTWVTPTNVLYLGDSLANGNEDMAARAIFHSGIPGHFQTTAVAGSSLSGIPSVLNGFDLSPYDTVVIQRVTNDVGGGASFATIQQRLMQTLVMFQNYQVLVVNCPPLDALSVYTERIQLVIDQYNAWVKTLWGDLSNKRVYDLNAAWDTTGDKRLDDNFVQTVGNIHPNNLAYDVAGQGIAARLTP